MLYILWVVLINNTHEALYHYGHKQTQFSDLNNLCAPITHPSLSLTSAAMDCFTVPIALPCVECLKLESYGMESSQTGIFQVTFQNLRFLHVFSRLEHMLLFFFNQ